MATLRDVANWLSKPKATRRYHLPTTGGNNGALDASPPKSAIEWNLAKVHALDKRQQKDPFLAERQPPRLVGMRDAHIKAPIFVRSDPKNARMSQLMLAGGVYGLMLQNIAWLKAHPETPDLYEAGVTYKPERRRQAYGGKVAEYGEEWQTIPYVIYRGYGDCEDLGAWRSAELRAKYNIQANPFIKMRHMPDGFWRAHVVVRWPNGAIEDPSAKLGMYTFQY
jgi:hypothetical protein